MEAVTVDRHDMRREEALMHVPISNVDDAWSQESVTCLQVTASLGYTFVCMSTDLDMSMCVCTHHAPYPTGRMYHVCTDI
jgi:hypothetical protein